MVIVILAMCSVGYTMAMQGVSFNVFSDFVSLQNTCLLYTSAYIPRCCIDNDVDKVGREIQGIPVWSENKATFRKLSELEVQEIVFAIPSMDVEKKKTLYEYYKNAGYKLKVYDYPIVYTAGEMCIRDR